MRRFQFRLESVLGWRGLDLDLEKSRLEKLFAERGGWDRQLAEIENNCLDSARLLEAKILGGPELEAFARYRRHLERETESLNARRADCEKRIAAQQKRVLEAERSLRLLERLKQRRLEEWTAEFGRELDAQASEAFLAKWVREKR